MATYDSTPLSLIAGADLTGKRNYFGKHNGTGIVVCSVAGEAAHVIIASEPSASGQAVDGWTERAPKVLAGGTFAAGANLTTNASGKAIEATAGQVVNAIALDAGADGRVVGVMRPLAIGLSGDGSYQAIAASGAISPTAGRVDVSIDATKAYTLADGVVGHEMDILIVAGTNTPIGTLTIATPFTGESATHKFRAAGARLRLRMTSAGWKVIAKSRMGSLTVVVGTTVLTGDDMVETYNLNVDATATSDLTKALPPGQVEGEVMWVRLPVGTNTPVANIDGTFLTLAGAAATHLQFNATTDYAKFRWDGSAWQNEINNSVTLS